MRTTAGETGAAVEGVRGGTTSRWGDGRAEDQIQASGSHGVRK